MGEIEAGKGVAGVAQYKSETLHLRRKEEANLERVEIRMLRWIMGILLLKDGKMT